MTRFEAEVLPGLEPFARKEIEASGGQIERVESGAVVFSASRWEPWYALRRTVAVYRVVAFEVPRPKSLLGDEHFRRLAAEIEEVRRRAQESFSGFRFSAAGADSPVFQRLAAALEKATGLGHDDESGELLLRIRPATSGTGWEVLPRLTPRPLSARAWRVCNMAGGLNATLAAAMHDVAVEGADLRRVRVSYLNAMCGSGTLLVEWRAAGATGRAVACDSDPDALSCCRQNVAAAGLQDSLENSIEARLADATALDDPDNAYDVITADVPWGDAVGSHASNAALYPAFLAEAARLLSPDGALVVLTHEIELFEDLLRKSDAWRTDRVVKVFHGGHWPRIYRLVRADDDTRPSDMLAR